MRDFPLFKFEILDCTIRDGGYLNNWHFDKKFARELYRNISRTGVDFIEIGFRNIQEKDFGIWYSTPEELINEMFHAVSGAAIALMVDEDSVDLSHIPQAAGSLVKMYRITCHRDRVLAAINLADKIKAKGYKVSLQLMGIVSYVQDDFNQLIQPLKAAEVDYIYFADSYGSLLPQDIKKFIDWLKPTGKKIGFHAHNNLQLAFANTLEAIHNGIDIVDGTVYGMGRGAGNLPLEVLIIYLEKTLNSKRYNAIPALDLIDRYFIRLKGELKWGYNLPYMLSGATQVHPNYAKCLMDNYQYNMDDIAKILEIVKDMDPIGFNRTVLERLIQKGFASARTEKETSEHDEEEVDRLATKFSVAYKNRHEGQDFLVLANGPSLKEYKKDINEFIETYRPIIIGANYLGGLLKPHYHAFSNKKRFVNYIDQVDPDSKLLLSSSLEEDFVRDYTDRDYEYLVHLNRLSSQFDIQRNIITSNCRTISILLIGVAIVMGANRIFIAGMDGYKNREIFLAHKTHFYQETAETEDFQALLDLHNWNERLLDNINSYLISNNKEGLHIITPTSHKSFYNSFLNWKAH